MVEVFKTNVQSHYDAITLKEILLKEFPDVQINFDLDDCDKILRAEGNNVPAISVIQIVKTKGFYCEILEE
jgi:hypothetical protein